MLMLTCAEAKLDTGYLFLDPTLLLYLLKQALSVHLEVTSSASLAARIRRDSLPP